MSRLQLRSVVFAHLRGSENEVGLIKYLLACSPFLKKLCIWLNASSIVADGKFMFAKKIVKARSGLPYSQNRPFIVLKVLNTSSILCRFV